MGEIIDKDLIKINEMLKEQIGDFSYKKVERLGGLTNHNYYVALENGRELVFRIPGDGTEDIISREDERKSTKLACNLKIDAKCIYFGQDGSKITEYIKNPVTMDASKFKKVNHMKEIVEILSTLHRSGIDTAVRFDVFEMAKKYEKSINKHNVFMYDDYNIVKDIVSNIKSEIASICDITLVPCHNDPLCENWVYGNSRMYLIDWEYAGMNDGMWDLADVSIEAGYDTKLDEELLTMYFGEKPNKNRLKLFYANKIYVDYLWTLWAKARIPFEGQSMETWARERYERLKQNIEIFKSL